MNMEMVQWQTKQLRDVLTIGNGRDYKHLQNGDVPVYGTGGVMTYVNEYLYDGETVCIGRKGTIDKPIYHIGKIWTVDTLFFTHSFIGVIPLFLYYEFCNVNWNKYNEATGVPSLSKETIYKIGIPIPVESDGTPSLPIQRRIAEILSSVDKVIASTEALIEKYKAIKMGLLDDLLQPKEEWIEKSLDSICDFFVGGDVDKNFFSLYQTSYFKYPIYSNALVNKGLYGYSSKYDFDKEAVTITGRGDVGNIFYRSPFFSTIIRLITVIPKNKNIDTRYLSYAMARINFVIESTGVPQLTAPQAKKYSVYFPSKDGEPDLFAQRRIASILRSIDNKIDIEQKTLEKYISMKKGLMKDLFTGK